MSRFLKLPIACLTLLTAAVSASASTTISSPANGAQVPSTFTLTVDSDTCSNHAILAMGYSFDDSPNTQIVISNSIDRQVTYADGPHVLHVKAWTGFGDVCVTDAAITINDGTNTPPPTDEATSMVPANAISVSDIQTFGGWFQRHDAGTRGNSSGSTSLVSNPALSGNARVFNSTFSGYGGHRFAVQVSDDDNTHNFLYDTWVYIDGSADGFSNIEMDLNQVLPNGWTVIMGFQCDGWTNTWDYTANTGSANSPHDKWFNSNAHCDPKEWTANQWHHVQVMYSRDDSGNVTYKHVWLDGARQELGYTVFAGFALGWRKTLLTNFQLDGSRSGTSSAKLYLDKFTIYRW